MTEKSSNRPRMTWQTWLILGVFACFGIYGLTLNNIGNKIQENKEKRVRVFMEYLNQGDYDGAYELVSEEWQAVLENAEGLEQAFTDINITNLNFSSLFRNCTTNPGNAGSVGTMNSDSKQYSYANGTARINGEEQAMRFRLASESGSYKILAIVIDDISIGLDIPNGCVYSDSY